jgi:hypothetical protein
MSVERDDIGVGSGDSTLFAMPQLTEPHAQARDDYATFGALADRLQVGELFTEGRTDRQWLRHLYGQWRSDLKAAGHEMPPFEEFWAGESLEIPVPDPGQVLLSAFRCDPGRSPLRTPSGKIEIFSAAIDSFGYPDCPGHPVWLEPAEWLGGHPGRHPLQLVANQPRRRLHSQLDVGAYSQEGKIGGREPAAMHPDDAAARGITDRSCVRLFNDRGSCLAGVTLTEDVRPGVVQLSTGAWYDPDPDDPSFCRHGNPNVLTADRPSSALSQGNTGQLAMVEIEPYAAMPPEVSVHRPPRLAVIWCRLGRLDLDSGIGEGRSVAEIGGDERVDRVDGGVAWGRTQGPGANVLCGAESRLAGLQAHQAQKPAVVADDCGPPPPGRGHRPVHLSQAGPGRHRAARESSERRGGSISSLAPADVVAFHDSLQVTGRADDQRGVDMIVAEEVAYLTDGGRQAMLCGGREHRLGGGARDLIHRSRIRTSPGRHRAHWRREYGNSAVLRELAPVLPSAQWRTVYRAGTGPGRRYGERGSYGWQGSD